MKHVLTTTIFLLLITSLTSAQTLEELQAMKAEKETAVTALQAEIDGLKAQIDALPGWDIGAFGTLGFNLSNFNNWVKGANPNAVSSSIRATVNAFARVTGKP